MSGHSKWSTIKRQKGVADAKRSAVFTKFARQISLAARAGKDPDGNFQLRLAIDRARAVNMPNDNVERAIRAGSGGNRGTETKEMLYEGFGPGQAAVMVQVLTDNPNRTGAEIRALFAKFGGSLGSTNSVGWMFAARGIIRLPLAGIKDWQAVELGVIDVGAEDVTEETDQLLIQTAPETLAAVRDWLTSKQFAPTSVDLELVPSTTIELKPADQTALHQLLTLLDEHDDVIAVFTNEA